MWAVPNTKVINSQTPIPIFRISIHDNDCHAIFKSNTKYFFSPSFLSQNMWPLKLWIQEFNKEIENNNIHFIRCNQTDQSFLVLWTKKRISMRECVGFFHFEFNLLRIFHMHRCMLQPALEISSITLISSNSEQPILISGNAHSDGMMFMLVCYINVT